MEPDARRLTGDDLHCCGQLGSLLLNVLLARGGEQHIVLRVWPTPWGTYRWEWRFMASQHSDMWRAQIVTVSREVSPLELAADGALSWAWGCQQIDAALATNEPLAREYGLLGGSNG